MPKPRTCPQCGSQIPIDHGFHFDENLNLVHEQCEKIAFSVLKPVATSGTTAFPELGNRYGVDTPYKPNSNGNWVKNGVP